MQSLDPAKQGVIAATARALKARLATYFPPDKFIIELMPAAITKTVWLKMAQKTPFIGLAFRDVEVPGSAGAAPVVEQRWQVHLVVNASTAELRLLGDNRSPGLVNMLVVALLVLHAWAIDDVGTVSCGTASSLGGEFLSDTHGVVGIPLSIPTCLVPDEVIAGLDDLAALDIIWNFNPGLTDPEPAPPPPAPPPLFPGTNTLEIDLED